ncbi:MAG TPA: DNA starvation/stationary phase protection protein [Sphingomicrobium sp.]|nr:DNA starvation/stationary phase protection protein [Sphingomicrobium sp.]
MISPIATSPAQLSDTAAFDSNSVSEISSALNLLLADIFALYLKTKNFHWHISGPHFRDYHLLLDEQSDQIFAMADPIAERVRKIGGTTIRSVGHVAKLQRIVDSDAERVAPSAMLGELREDNRKLTIDMRLAHEICTSLGDIATASLLEEWIDETEHRAWYLSQATAA